MNDDAKGAVRSATRRRAGAPVVAPTVEPNTQPAPKDIRPAGGFLWALAGALVPVVGWYFLLRALPYVRPPAGGGRRRFSAGMAHALLVGMVAQIGAAPAWFVVLSHVREEARQTVCGTRLSGIGKAMGIYSAENRGIFPCLAGPDGPVRKFDDDVAMREDMDALWSNDYDCNLQAMWLLVYSGESGENLYECPGDADYVMPDHARGGYGFGSWRNCSYAIQPLTRHEDNKGFPGASGQDSATVIAGDKQIGAGRYTLNHPGGGNFLTAGLSVHYRKKEWNFVGWNRNQVYLRDVIASGDSAVELKVSPEVDDPGAKLSKLPSGVLPAHASDSVLFWRDDAGKTPTRLQDRQPRRTDSPSPEDVDPAITDGGGQMDAARRSADSPVGDRPGRQPEANYVAPEEAASSITSWLVWVFLLSVGAIVVVAVVVALILRGTRR